MFNPSVLSFLHDGLERGLSLSTLKVYVALFAHITMQWMEIHGKARLDRQVPEGSEETESASRPLYTLLGLISGATEISL